MDYQSTKQLRSSWEFSKGALQAFLEWLDDGTESAGNSYIAMQQRLSGYFDRKGCMTPVDLADETMSRVARRLEEEGRIETETPAKYCYVVARFVFLEHIRDSSRRGEVQFDEVNENRRNTGKDTDTEESELKERMLKCLDVCSEKLISADRSMIFRYYIGVERKKIENRQRMAHELGISANALSIRACRIRSKLEGCVKKCADAMEI